MFRPGTGVFFGALMALSVAAFAADDDSNQIIVKYRDDVVRIRSNNNELYNRLGVKKVRRFSKAASSYEHLTLDASADTARALAELQGDETVEYAQPDYPLQAFDGGEVNESKPAIKDAPTEMVPAVTDPNLSKAYGLEQIGAPEAWKITRGSKDVIVAVIDTGIDYNHQDLSFNMWRNPNPSSANDIVGYDYYYNDGLPFDDNSHGTHVAGTIGAVGGNGVGISGVNQRVSLMALKFLNDRGGGKTSNAIRAIDYAVSHGAKILNNSWGGKVYNPALKDAIERAQRAGVLFVAAAGNDGTSNDTMDPSYPASFKYDNVFAVASTDDHDRIARTSNYGPRTTHIAAPGVAIFSTLPGGTRYGSKSGTSMASPHVAGAAALLWARHPSWDYVKIKQTLMNNVEKIPTLKKKVASGGRLNIYKALLESEETNNRKCGFPKKVKFARFTY